MREPPEGQDLLTIARTTLLEKVVPLLPQDQRYNALMVANAMAIALRQWQAGEHWQVEELQRLQALFGAGLSGQVHFRHASPERLPPDTAGLNSALHAANRALAQKIRHGEFDTLSPSAAELLEWMAVQRVRESAPKALAVR